MMKTIKAALLTSCATAMMAGCVTEGRDFRSETSWIKEKKTTKQDVQMVLKEPYAVGNSGGQPTWTYGYYRYRLIGASHQKELKFYWNPDGTVNSYSFSSNFEGDTGSATTSGNKPESPSDSY